MQDMAQESAREKAREAKVAKRQLVLDPIAQGRGYHPGGRPKKTCNFRGTKGGLPKTNRRMAGEQPLRREVPIVGRIMQILAVQAAAKKQGCHPSEMGPETWRALCARFGETRKDLLKLLPRLGEFSKYVHESRLGGQRASFRQPGGQTNDQDAEHHD